MGHNGDDDDGGCTLCARGGGLLLLGLAGILAWMGTDLLTGGVLTRMVIGRLPDGAFPPADIDDGDNGGQEEVTPSDDSA